MNSISACTDYTSEPYINFDFDPLGSYVDFYSQSSVNNFISLIKNIKQNGKDYCASGIIKSHHPSWIFEKALANNLKVVYIYRKPTDVFISYWKFIYKLNWTNNLIIRSPFDLCSMKPIGKAMRYQINTYHSFFDRWADHVQNWLYLSKVNSNVYTLEYDNLLNEHHDVMIDLCEYLDIKISSEIQKPSKYHNVVEGADLELKQNDLEEIVHYCTKRLEDYPLLVETFRKKS